MTARALFDRAARVDPAHQPVWQAWGVMEFRCGNFDTARALFQRGVWAEPKSKDAAKLFQAWGVLEDRQGNSSVARELFKCAVRADPSSAPSWLAWAQMEDRTGAVQRAAELRQLCLQERADESVGMQDLSPSGLESMLQPVLDRVRSLWGGAPEGDAGALASVGTTGPSKSADIDEVAAAAARTDSLDDQAVKQHVLSVIETVAGARELAFNRRERAPGGQQGAAGGGKQRFGSGKARKQRVPLGVEAYSLVVAPRTARAPPPLAGADAEIIFSAKLVRKAPAVAAAASPAAQELKGPAVDRAKEAPQQATSEGAVRTFRSSSKVPAVAATAEGSAADSAKGAPMQQQATRKGTIRTFRSSGSSGTRR